MPADRFVHPKCSKSHKCTRLNDLEFRVWIQYLLSSDDFGVMHATALQLQSANLYLASRPAKIIAKCIETLIVVGLLHKFEHQGQPYVFQTDWQRWQKVEYPRATDNPRPPDEAVALCDEATRLLFAKHPGGQRKDRKRPEHDPNHLGRASQIDSESVPPTRGGAPAKRLTANANGLRPMANGERLTADAERPIFDGQAAFARLCAAYPAARVNDSQRVSVLFLEVLGPSQDWQANFDLMLANLETHKASHEWAVKRMVPNLEKWLEGGRWKRPMDADAAPRPHEHEWIRKARELKAAGGGE